MECVWTRFWFYEVIKKLFNIFSVFLKSYPLSWIPKTLNTTSWNVCGLIFGFTKLNKHILRVLKESPSVLNSQNSRNKTSRTIPDVYSNHFPLYISWSFISKFSLFALVLIGYVGKMNPQKWDLFSKLRKKPLQSFLYKHFHIFQNSTHWVVP